MKRGWKEGRVENSARSFHSRTNLHSRCIEGISLFDGRGSISRISAEQNNRMNGNRGWWSCPEHGVSDGQWNIRSTWINVLKMETLREREGGKGEKSMNGDIIFLPCIIRNRACRCRRVKISYVPGILVYISAEYRNLSVSSSSLQSGDFNFPAIDRAKKGKSIDRASPPRRQFISNA